MIVGNIYLEQGRPVTVLVQWAGRGPRNVWIRREDGAEVVRPFRGLRKITTPALDPLSAGEGAQ